MLPWPYPLWLAHRGAGKRAPENTLAAFRLGAALGWRGYECDVRLSADGQPFLLHDDTLERTTSGRGEAGARPWAALAGLDAGGWHSPAFAGEPLPRLADIAAFVIGQGHALNIEIKPAPGTAAATGRGVALAAQALWQAAVAGGAAWPLLSSFQPEALAAAQQAAPALPRALLLERLRRGWLDEALALGCVAVVTDYRRMDAGLVARLHAAGLRALCYTVNRPASARRLLALGVDGLISDAVDRLGPGAG